MATFYLTVVSKQVKVKKWNNLFVILWYVNDLWMMWNPLFVPPEFWPSHMYLHVSCPSSQRHDSSTHLECFCVRLGELRLFHSKHKLLGSNVSLRRSRLFAKCFCGMWVKKMIDMNWPSCSTVIASFYFLYFLIWHASLLSCFRKQNHFATSRASASSNDHWRFSFIRGVERKRGWRIKENSIKENTTRKRKAKWCKHSCSTFSYHKL